MLQLPLEPLDTSMPVPDCPHAALGRLPTPHPRVISASKRTDIPAFYLKWMIAGCQEGWVDVPNPMFRRAPDPLKRLTHVSLRPEHVLAIVWWSKNYAVYERFHQAFVPYRCQYFHFTINSRRQDLAWLEPDVPPLGEVLRQVRFLVDKHGPHMLAWRYDPLVFWTEGERRYSNWDADFFAQMCAELGRLGVTQVFTSIADHYRKFEQRMQRCWPTRHLRDPEPAELQELTCAMQQMTVAHGLYLVGCTEPALAACGIPAGSCISASLLRQEGGPKIPAGRASDTHMAGRETCGCTIHTDIGDYVEQECGYACAYCYANPNHKRFTSAV